MGSDCISSWSLLIFLLCNGNKNIMFVEATVVNNSAKFQLHSPYGFRGDDFLIFFRTFSLSAVWTKFIRLLEDYSRNFLIITTRVLIRLEQKHNYLFPPPIDNIIMWYMVRIGFRGDVVLKCWRTTTDDGQRMPTYIISSPKSLRLRWDKKL